MSVAVLSIGSNVGDRLAHLRSVVEAAGARLSAASGVYETAPWGGIEQQPFLNAVLLVTDNDRGANQWLRFAHDRERQAQRTRDVRWGPRTLDVDIVAAYDAAGEPIVSDDPDLTLPHPRAHERAFVLAPWLEVDPHARLPHGVVAELLDELVASGDPQQQVARTELELR
ncbi:2-amino-4-hydroxy-6-hydroxymethyldihydropteridine diphosphokinase [Epidermidibacterium keratini]|uniref:2-amino-4-hydroxy-6-hydroxymethyldihydropteridine diphosphokinase n=1 Tax=Epidermidibacterium keratini TaxID=1891644 RepID=A0A7L4YPQ6_9ACTN|nr:2-amino-4-hydroxy-6-hydroxymethyldihydropteridine diphosphokinase [Epidermidibacterium keratini]QHC01002.1 2-amino-4-hydroxy-6-hydroxymethyldihydropteridine diphosphokinase [Epidermidibacterium keratini]